MKRLWLAVSLVLLSIEGAGAGAIVDSAGRTVTVPDRIDRVFVAGPPASVLLYVLAPEKMVGWTSRPRAAERPFLLPSVRDLPELGRLTGRGDTANVEVVIATKPDLIVDYGSVNDTTKSLADRVQGQLGIPYLLIDGRFDRSAASVRLIGDVLGVPARGETIARAIEDTLADTAAKLAGLGPDRRRRVYLARGADGLETGLTGSINTEIIERAGGINVAAAGGARGGLARVSLEQVLAWNPDTIVTWDRNFLAGVYADPAWAPIEAVRDRRVFFSPELPFGWIDRPPSLNRMLGLVWMTGVLYPDRFPGDFRAATRDFFKRYFQTDLSESELATLLDATAGSGR